MARKKTTGSRSKPSSAAADDGDKIVAETDVPSDEEAKTPDSVEEPTSEETEAQDATADAAPQEPPSDEASSEEATQPEASETGDALSMSPGDNEGQSSSDSAETETDFAEAVTDGEGTDPADAETQDSEAAVAEDTDADVKEDAGSEADTLQDLPEAEVAEEKPAPPQAPQPKQQAANPGALVFGGVIAGAIGFAAAYFGLAQQSDPEVSGLTSDISALREEVSALAETPAPEPDLGPVLAQIEDIASQLGAVDAQFVETQNLIDEVNTRIDAIEGAAVAETLPEGAQEAFAAELEAAREAIAAERTALADMMAEAQASETKANEAAQAALHRAALSEIKTALDTGSAFSAPLNELSASGVTVSEGLMQTGTTGVVPLASLQQSFPPAAREALEAARKTAEGTSGFEGFVRAQLGVRSLEPKEGDDPDAVLSRAEAALDAANLSEALAEIETLPPEALAALASWVDDATTRRDTMQAVQDLSDSLE